MNDLIQTPDTKFIHEPMPDDAPEWAKVLHRQNAQVLNTIQFTAGIVDRVAAEITPLVDTLSNHPMFKMFGGRK